MAVMYSKLGGCLGDTAKLGPLARTDLCAGVKGLLDTLMTHLGLGSSMEEPWGDCTGGKVAPYKHMFSSSLSDLMKSTAVDESLSTIQPMFCSREYQAISKLKLYLGYSRNRLERSQCDF